MTKDKNTYYKLPVLDGLELLDAKNHKTNFPLHTHDTYNIALVLNTTLVTSIQGKMLNAPIGSLFITNPEDIRATLCEPKIGNTFFTFYVSPTVVKTLNDNSNVCFENRVIHDRGLFENFRFLSLRFKDQKVDFELLFTITLRHLISKYARKAVLKPKNMNLFKSYLIEAHTASFSLEKAAHQFGLNKYKFLRLFKQETGLTPNHYMILKRIEKSKKLLNKGNAIADVAIASGFYDTAHYCRHFKKIMGVTPITYQSA